MVSSEKSKKYKVVETVIAYTLDLLEISLEAFRFNLNNKRNVLFGASLYDIERELESRVELLSDLDN